MSANVAGIPLPKKRTSRKVRISLSALATVGANMTLWDTEIGGFGVRVQKHVPVYFLKTRVNGRQVWLTIGKHGSPWTPDLARKEALRLLVEAQEGRDNRRPTAKRAADGGITVSAAIARFRVEHMPKLKSRTRVHYEWTLSRLIEPKFGRHALTALDPASIGSFHVGLKDTPVQANGTLTILSSFLGWCMDVMLCPRGENPCARVRRFKVSKRERYLSKPELMRLAAALDAAEEKEEHSIYALAAIRLLILTGARLSEITTLKWEFVSFDHARLALPESKTGFKFIALNAQAIAVLTGLPRIPGNPYVLPSSRSGRHMAKLQVVWSALRKTAGIEDVRVHDLRHSFASFAVDAGASLPLVGRLLGHASVTTTARYAHLSDKRANEVNQAVGDAIEGVMTGKKVHRPNDGAS